MKIQFLLIITVFVFTSSCNRQVNTEKTFHDGFNILVEFLEKEKNYINSLDVPFFTFPPNVFHNLDKNILIIDLRAEEEFKKGHINNSVNVEMSEILDYFENHIHPPAYDEIALVCNTGSESVFVAMGLKFLGYDNVFPMRNGLSAWDKSIAVQYWQNNISDFLIDELEITDNPKNEKTAYPVIKTKHKDPYDILRERVSDVFSGNYSDYSVNIFDVLQYPDNYYLISYWTRDRYDRGHIPGSIQYEPRESLHTQTYLNTLPTDRPIVLQCYSGFHSAFVSLYLRLLGYDAINLDYGANSFMYSIMKREERPSRHFGDKDIFNYPLMIGGKSEITDADGLELRKMGIEIDGGC